MVGASTGVYKFSSVVRGQHVYNSVWMSLTDETHKLEDNNCSEYAVNDRLWQYLKKDTHIKRDLQNKLYFP